MSDSVTILNGGPSAVCYDLAGRMLYPGDTVTTPATEQVSNLLAADVGVVVVTPPAEVPAPVKSGKRATTTTTAADDAADSKE